MLLQTQLEVKEGDLNNNECCAISISMLMEKGISHWDEGIHSCLVHLNLEDCQTEL